MMANRGFHFGNAHAKQRALPRNILRAQYRMWRVPRMPAPGLERTEERNDRNVEGCSDMEKPCVDSNGESHAAEQRVHVPDGKLSTPVDPRMSEGTGNAFQN